LLPSYLIFLGCNCTKFDYVRGFTADSARGAYIASQGSLLEFGCSNSKERKKGKKGKEKGKENGRRKKKKGRKGVNRKSFIFHTVTVVLEAVDCVEVNIIKDEKLGGGHCRLMCIDTHVPWRHC